MTDPGKDLNHTCFIDKFASMFYLCNLLISFRLKVKLFKNSREVRS